MFQVQISAVAIYILLGLLFTEMRVCILFFVFSRLFQRQRRLFRSSVISKISLFIIAEMD